MEKMSKNEFNNVAGGAGQQPLGAKVSLICPECGYTENVQSGTNYGIKKCPSCDVEVVRAETD